MWTHSLCSYFTLYACPSSLSVCKYNGFFKFWIFSTKNIRTKYGKRGKLGLKFRNFKHMENIHNLYFSSNFDMFDKHICPLNWLFKELQVEFQRISSINYGFHVELDFSKTDVGGSTCRLAAVVSCCSRCSSTLHYFSYIMTTTIIARLTEDIIGPVYRKVCGSLNNWII